MYENGKENSRKNEVSILNWLGTLILSAIPVVNLVVFIVWAVSSRKPAKRNYAIAALILTVVIVVALVLLILFGSEWLLNWVASVDASSVFPT